MDANRPNPWDVRKDALAAVEAELRRRRYEIEPVLSGATADLSVRSTSSGARFRVKVHGFRRPNNWIVRPEAEGADLYYVLAVVPPTGSNRFFVLSRAEAAKEVERTLARLGRSNAYPVKGFTFGAGTQYEEQWQRLPA